MDIVLLARDPLVQTGVLALAGVVPDAALRVFLLTGRVLRPGGLSGLVLRDILWIDHRVGTVGGRDRTG